VKKIRNWVASLTNTALITGLALNFNACSKNEALLGHKEVETIPSLSLLDFGKTNLSLKKKVKTSKLCTKKKGGKLYLEYEYNLEEGEVEVAISLRVLPGALSEDKELQLEIDDEHFLGNFDVIFSQHGTVFSQPAILNIEIKIEDIDPSSLNLDNLDIYYDNPATGEWELMPRDAINIDIDDDEIEIKVVNARIPHFSRYAIGAE